MHRAFLGTLLVPVVSLEGHLEVGWAIAGPEPLPQEHPENAGDHQLHRLIFACLYSLKQ